MRIQDGSNYLRLALNGSGNVRALRDMVVQSNCQSKSMFNSQSVIVVNTANHPDGNFFGEGNGNAPLLSTGS